jgi:hypothetical protein
LSKPPAAAAETRRDTRAPNARPAGLCRTQPSASGDRLRSPARYPLFPSLSCFCNSTGTALAPFCRWSRIRGVLNMATDDECLRVAHEYARLAGLTKHRNVRDQLIDLARGWTAIAQHERRSDARMLCFTPATNSPETQQRSASGAAWAPMVLPEPIAPS